MRFSDEPSIANDFHAIHVRRLRASLRGLTGRDLMDLPADEIAAARCVYEASLAVVSSDTQDDSVFNYANRTALELFEMSWEELTQIPSRYSAEPDARAERDRLMAQVAEFGVIHDYTGIRISKTGRRFLIHDATVWMLSDEQGAPYGRAATFDRWDDVEPET